MVSSSSSSLPLIISLFKLVILVDQATRTTSLRATYTPDRGLKLLWILHSRGGGFCKHFPSCLPNSYLLGFSLSLIHNECKRWPCLLLLLGPERKRQKRRRKNWSSSTSNLNGTLIGERERERGARGLRSQSAVPKQTRARALRGAGLILSGWARARVCSNLFAIQN